MKAILVDLNVDNEVDLTLVIEKLIRTELVKLDTEYKPVRIINKKEDRITYIVRGQATEDNIIRITELPYVYKVWNDFGFDLFCSCNSGVRGNLNRVAKCIGAKDVWDKGYRGRGIVVGIVDSGVDKDLIPQVINGAFPNWGTPTPPTPTLYPHGNFYGWCNNHCPIALFV